MESDGTLRDEDVALAGGGRLGLGGLGYFALRLHFDVVLLLELINLDSLLGQLLLAVLDELLELIAVLDQVG